jgi:hypothetical protein
MIDPGQATRFLALPRIAVVGASDDPKNFGGTIVRELASRGRDVIAVHPSARPIGDAPCVDDLAALPGDVDGVIVMVHRDRAAAVVRQCVDRGVRRVWLFKGGGGASAVSDEAVRLCREHGVECIEGACPLMFLEPAAWFHRVHRAARRLTGAVAAAS